MRAELVLRHAAVLVIVALVTTSGGSPYFAEDSFEDSDDYSENGLDTYIQQTQYKRTPTGSIVYSPMRRACLRHGASCDSRREREECCYSSSCRCNLFGSNCKCQRMGRVGQMLQKMKWGRK